ncbi:tyrosine-type recombinase/integrase [Clostridium magnum]|uniref:Tyrosine recombinase XerC n=1 Tax=Clostridium magnum DSM 2767 TaxID=1121326 RepID=A0A162R095_9CLOT|nr:tyrosine-type recombinase/integrase [Clostridium magnum]KZL89227.1 tyrosine recombinase XerC [Clostridium magnum DSM 2767]SHJ36991.1 Site-specific recombinase XerD [Clostridium magnum DSM 2767]
MSELRNKMKMYMELKGYSTITTKYYLTHVSNFSKFYNKSPLLLGEKEICGYLHYCITEKHLTIGSVNSINAALKLFYTKVLNKSWDINTIPRMKERRRLPVALSPQEVKAIFDATDNIKHKAILMTTYSAGLRVSEVCKLKIKDIDSKNMQIFIRQGKGKKDRYSLLSKANLKILREYWKKYKPKEFLFSGRYRTDAITPRSVQRIFEKARKKAGITKNATVHTLRHSFATHLLDAGTDICYIQRLLGHTRITTTTIYLHLRRMDLLSVKSPLDILLGEGND